MKHRGPTGEELLNSIPEELRDVPHPDLLGETPRQVVEQGHVKFTAEDPGCPMCRDTLRRLAS